MDFFTVSTLTGRVLSVLFFLSHQGGAFNSGPTTTLMAVKVGTAPAFRAAAPERLFDSVDLRYAWGRSYDVGPDGRFLLTLSSERPTNLAPAQMLLVQHWFEELKRLVPAQ